jgi:hypothetical protein
LESFVHVKHEWQNGQTEASMMVGVAPVEKSGEREGGEEEGLWKLRTGRFQVWRQVLWKKRKWRWGLDEEGAGYEMQRQCHG